MKKLKNFVYVVVFMGTFFSCNHEIQKTKPIDSGWKSVYKHDENGNPINGNIDSLIAGIRNGNDVKVGWGWQRMLGDSILKLEHLAEPLFLTIIQEKNVSIVIDAHPLLHSYIDVDSQKFGEGGHTWQCVLTTKGTFNAQVYNRSTGELLKDWPQKHKMTWFLEYPDNAQINNKPLYD